MDETTSQNILKALLLILSRMNDISANLANISNSLKESVNPKQEESN
jgi:hypothetical protein